MSLTEPTQRPVQQVEVSGYDWARPKIDSGRQYTWRTYDAVGPETMTMLELMENFAKLNGRTLNPVFVDYRNFEMVLNVASLGNLNRQFVSLLRSEQDAERHVRPFNSPFNSPGPQVELPSAPSVSSRTANV